MVVGGRWEEQEGDESVPCSMEMELYCCCMIATQHRSCLQEGNSKILSQTQAQVHVDAANIHKGVLGTIKQIYYTEH